MVPVMRSNYDIYPCHRSSSAGSSKSSSLSSSPESVDGVPAPARKHKHLQKQRGCGGSSLPVSPRTSHPGQATASAATIAGGGGRMKASSDDCVVVRKSSSFNFRLVDKIRSHLSKSSRTSHEAP